MISLVNFKNLLWILFQILIYLTFKQIFNKLSYTMIASKLNIDYNIYRVCEMLGNFLL